MQAHWEHRLLALAGEPPHPVEWPLRIPRTPDASLDFAYRVSADTTAQHSKSFFMASGLLPAEKRHAVRALYAFCRTVDDIVDASQAADRAAELDRWRQIVRTTSAPQGDPVSLAWVDTITRFHIPAHFAVQLIDGVARDIFPHRYETFDELSTYCYGVASTVGLMSMYIVGFRSKDAIPYAIKLGVALQMTNILRDIGEDYRNGRIYLPREEMKAFGISEQDLQACRVTDRWRAFMRFQIDRTRRLYEESRPGIAMLHRDGQPAIAAASSLYRGILDVIERNDFDNFTQRASLPTWEKLRRLPGILLSPTNA